MQVLHVVGGDDYRGGTMNCAVDLASTPLDGYKSLVWKHRNFHSHGKDSIFLCRGRVRRTDVSWPGDFFGGLREALPLAFWSRRICIAILHAHTRMGLFASIIAGKLTGIPLVVHFHARANRPLIYRKLWAQAKALPVFNSRGTCLHYGCDPAEAFVIVPSITWPAAPPSKESGPRRFIAASSFVRCKNLHIIIEAFNRITAAGVDAQLVIYGASPKPLDPEYQDEITAAARLNPRIRLAPYDPDWHSNLLASDIFVHAFSQEGFGIVILEAFAKGCALVIPTGTFLDDLTSPLGSEAIFRMQSLEAGEMVETMKEALKYPPAGTLLWTQRQQCRPSFSRETLGERLLPVYQFIGRQRSRLNR